MCILGENGMTEPIAVSINEAARLAGCGRSTLYAEIKLGNLPITKIGRRTVVTVANLKDWLAAKSDETSK